MYIFRFERKSPINNCEDYASYYFIIVARNQKEAWNKAVEVEPFENIASFQVVKRF